MAEFAPLELFFKKDGKTYPIGTCKVRVFNNPAEQASAMATVLHEMAWQYEEKVSGNYGKLESRATESPRVVITQSDDRYFEVVSNGFVLAASYDDAIESFGRFRETTTFWEVLAANPGCRWEYL